MGQVGCQFVGLIVFLFVPLAGCYTLGPTILLTEREVPVELLVRDSHVGDVFLSVQIVIEFRLTDHMEVVLIDVDRMMDQFATCFADQGAMKDLMVENGWAD